MRSFINILSFGFFYNWYDISNFKKIRKPKKGRSFLNFDLLQLRSSRVKDEPYQNYKSQIYLEIMCKTFSEPPRLICVPNLIKTSQSPDLINLTPFASEHHHQSHQHIHQQPSNQRRPSTDRNKSDHSSSPPAQPRQVDESGRRSTSSDDGDLSAAKAVPEAPTALVEKEDGEMGNRRLSSAVHVAPAQHQFSASPTAVFQASRIDAIDEEKSGEAPNGRQLVEDDIFEVVMLVQRFFAREFSQHQVEEAYNYLFGHFRWWK